MNLSAVKSGLFKYPLANPTPPMYNSPIAPIGNGTKLLSKTYNL